MVTTFFWLSSYDVELPPQHVPWWTMKYEAPTDSYYISSGDHAGMWFKSDDLFRLKFDDLLIDLNSADPDPIDDTAFDTFIQGGGA